MLLGIKESIACLPPIGFAEYYQRYIKSVQDSIINKDVKAAKPNFTSMDDTMSMVEGLNKLTEELNKI